MGWNWWNWLAKDVVATVLNLWLWRNNTYKKTYHRDEWYKIIFSPDQAILRGEVFQFLYNSLELLAAQKSVINIDFKVLDTYYQTDLSMISNTKKPCIDPKDTFAMWYWPNKEYICWTPEYQKANINFEKAFQEFIGGKYKENLAEVCRLFGGIYGGCMSNIRIEKNNIFIIVSWMWASEIYQIVIYNNKLFSRVVGSYDETSTSFPDEEHEAFYQQILNWWVIQK